MDTDREILDAVFETIGMVKPEDSKVVRIKIPSNLVRWIFQKNCWMLQKKEMIWKYWVNQGNGIRPDGNLLTF